MNFDLSFLHLPSLLIGAFMGAVVLAAILVPYLIRLERDRAALRGETMAQAAVASAMDDHFKAVAQEALALSQQQFLALAQERLSNVQKDASFDLDKRHKAIADMVDPIGKTLKDLEVRLEDLGKSGAALDIQLKSFADDQKLLRNQTSALVSVMKNSALRGRWGEMQLSRILELTGMVRDTHYRQQVRVQGDANTQQPDFIVDLPGHLSIVIDVKTPLEPYWDLTEDGDVAQHANEDQIRRFTGLLRDHVKKLSAKEYWRQFDSPQFVVMFLPTEALFAFAVTHDRALIGDAAESNVILASPSTLLGLLRVVMHGWQQQKLAENARAIGDMAVELNTRMGSFVDHLAKVGRNLGTVVQAYNAAVGSVESRIMPQLRKIDEYQGQATSFTDLPRLEQTPRDMNVAGDKAA
jgi:DNA recombination protein RmuC